MTTQKLDELQMDVDELNQLMTHATRQRIKDILSLETRKLETEMIKLKEQQTGNEDAVKKSPSVHNQNRCYDVKLTNYAWDQSEKFVKIFVTLKNVQSLPAENVCTQFTDRSMELIVRGLENRNYTLPIKNLLEKIDTEKSHWKVKTDMVVVFLAKCDTGKTWSHLTASEKKAKEPKFSPKLSENEDPTTGLMDLMKQMYEEGDDEMKRTIAKAWTESRSNAGLPNF